MSQVTWNAAAGPSPSGSISYSPDGSIGLPLWISAQLFGVPAGGGGGGGASGVGAAASGSTSLGTAPHAADARMLQVNTTLPSFDRPSMSASVSRGSSRP